MRVFRHFALSCYPRKKVVQHSTNIQEGQLVSIAQYYRGAVLRYPIAVGQMAVTSDTLRRAVEGDAKGKAAYVLHAWKDFLWDLGQGKKSDVPEPRPLPAAPQEEAEPHHGNTNPVAADVEADASKETTALLREPDAPTTEPETTEASPDDKVNPIDGASTSRSATIVNAEGESCSFELPLSDRTVAL